MKKLKNVISILLILVMMISAMPITALAATSKSPFDSKTYTHQAQQNGKEIINGIDLSQHNGTVDFAKLKNAGVKYVILRLGYRGYGDNGSLANDSMFPTYYDGAKKAGLLVGAYFYSQALNQSEAIAEADKALTALGGRQLDLPVAFDYEFASYNGLTGRLYKAWNGQKINNITINKNKNITTANAKAFCERIKSNGYEPMVYANRDFLYNQLNYSELENAGYKIWLAHYTTNTNYQGKFDFWQYTSSGKVNGVSGSVDCNFLYKSALTTPNPNPNPEPEPEPKPEPEPEPNPNPNPNPEPEPEPEPEPIVQLSVPTNFKLVNTTPNSLTLNWNAVEGATGYEIIRTYGESKTSFGEFTGTTAEIKGLNPSYCYYLAVRAFKVVNSKKYYSDPCDNISAITVPAKVTGIRASVTDTRINLSWTKAGYPESYRVYLYNATSKQYYLYRTVNTNSISITGLTPNVGYYFKVQAVRSNLVGEVSDYYRVFTAPQTPYASSAKSSSKKRITLKWNKNTRNAGYQVQWSTTSNFSSNTKSVYVAGSSATTKTIQTARSKTFYSIRVRSYVVRNGVKYYSPWSKAYRLKVK